LTDPYLSVRRWCHHQVGATYLAPSDPYLASRTQTSCRVNESRPTRSSVTTLFHRQWRQHRLVHCWLVSKGMHPLPWRRGRCHPPISLGGPTRLKPAKPRLTATRGKTLLHRSHAITPNMYEF
jgi:hypothetical protein